MNDQKIQASKLWKNIYDRGNGYVKALGWNTLGEFERR